MIICSQESLLNGFGEEGGKRETLGHVSTRALLVPLEESQVDPGAGDAVENQPHRGIGDDSTEREDEEDGGHSQWNMLKRERKIEIKGGRGRLIFVTLTLRVGGVGGGKGTLSG